MKIYVITLEKAKERQERIRRQFSEKGIDFEFVFGIDGRLLSQQEKDSLYDEKKSVSFYKWYRKGEMCGLTLGEIGCTLSHQLVYQKILDNKLKNAIVLEDDVVIDDRFFEVVNLLNTTFRKKQNYVIRLDNEILRGGVLFKTTKMNDAFRVKQYIFNTCAAGYYIDNKSAATMLSVNKPLFLISDEWNFFGMFVKLRSVNKCIVRQEAEKSYIWNNDSRRIINNTIFCKIIGKMKTFRRLLWAILFK